MNIKKKSDYASGDQSSETQGVSRHEADKVYRDAINNFHFNTPLFASMGKLQPLVEGVRTAFGKVGKVLWLVLFNLSMISWICVSVVALRLYRHPYQSAINTFLFVTLIFVAKSAVQLENDRILSRISDATVNEIIDVSNFTRGYDAEKVDKKGSRELLDAGAPKWNQQSSIHAILYHARKAQLSIEHQAVLLSIVEVESGFNPMARAPTTSACGLFQFVRATGRLYSLKRENCMDPWSNAEAGVKHYIDNYKNRVESEVTSLKGSERVFKLFELGYYLHHDGPKSLKPSDTVKNVVLRGTPFLLKVHAILENEIKSREQLTSIFGFLLVSLQDLAQVIGNLISRFVDFLIVTSQALME